MTDKNANTNMPKKSKFSERPLISYITNNFWLKIFSLIFALLLWSYVINENDPERTKTFSEQPIYVTGTEALLNNQLIPLEDLSVKLPEVNVVISVKHTKYSTATASNIDISIDLSRITSPGIHSVPVRVVSNNPDVTILSYSVETVDVAIDELASAIVPLKLITAGTLPANLYRSEPVITPATVQISGPKTYISKIAQAQINVDLSQITDGYSASLPFTYVDSEGNKISSNSISASTSVALVDMGIKSLKTVSLDYNSALINLDKMAEGYILKAANISQPTITIIGNADKLQQIDKISIKSIDLTGVSESIYDINVEPILPDGIEIYNPSAITLDITVAEETITRNFDVPITFINVPGLLMPQSNVDHVTVKVTGSYFTVKNLTANDIKAVVDLSGKMPGTNQVLPVSPKTNIPISNISMDAEPSEIIVNLTLQ